MFVSEWVWVWVWVCDFFKFANKKINLNNIENIRMGLLKKELITIDA